MEQGDRPGDDFSGHIERTVGPGVHTPLDQGHKAAFDLHAGDAAGMDAASCIIVVRRLRGQGGPMRVPGDQNAVMFLRPLV